MTASPPPLPNEPIITATPLLTRRFLPAHWKNYSSVPRSAPRFVVLHCTDGCEGTRCDEDVAAMFQDAALSPHRSAHFVVDADSISACVPVLQRAWHCGHTGNALGIGVELCGRAAQTRREWLDALSLPTLNNAAGLVAELCAQYKIPPVVVNDRGLVSGAGGITTHSFVSMAWKESTHHDPGVSFPLGPFVAAVAKATSLGR